MKTLYIFLFAVVVSAFAKAETPTSHTNATEAVAVNWTGTYATTFGEIILKQKGKHVVGTYKDLGGIRSLTLVGNDLYAQFDNNDNTGYVKWTKTASGFAGSWGWTNALEKGAWNGKKVKDANQFYIKGEWNSNYGPLDFIHTPTGILVAHYGNQGGMIWGKINNGTKIFKGKYRRKQGAPTEGCSFIFTNTTFKGKFNNREYGSWNGRRKEAVSQSSSDPTNAYILKVTMHKIKFNRNNEIGKKNKLTMQIHGSIEVNDRAIPVRNQQRVKTNTYYKSGKYENRWTLGDIRNINNSLQYHIKYGLSQITDADTFEHSFTVWDTPKGPMMVAAPRDIQRPIHLKETLKYLTGITDASDYPLIPGGNGARKLPNTPDRYRLETIGGKRYMQGYGDLLFDDGQLRFGYYYTIELVDKD